MASTMALTLAPPALVPSMALASVPVPLDPSHNHNCYLSSTLIEGTNVVLVPLSRERIPSDFSSGIYGGSGARVETPP